MFIFYVYFVKKRERFKKNEGDKIFRYFRKVVELCIM